MGVAYGTLFVLPVGEEEVWLQSGLERTVWESGMAFSSR